MSKLSDLIPKCPWTFLVSLGTLIAALLVLKAIYFVAKNIFVFYFAERLGLTTNFRSLGEWAVVTGATDGIGKGYAIDLARRGCNIVLISRTESKLRTVADEIETMYPGIKTKIITADFTSGDNIYEGIKKELADLEIGTLINNVGMMYPYPEYFCDLPDGDKLCVDLIRCNIVAQTLMTRIVAPQMVKRGKGVIVGLSSFAGTWATPLISLYCASKAFNDYLSRSLEMEYRAKGIIVQSVRPLVVATNMSMKPKSNIFILDSVKYAKSCLNSVGFFSTTQGHPSHAIQNWVAFRIPMSISGYFSLSVMTRFRAEVLRRLNEKKQL